MSALGVGEEAVPVTHPEKSSAIGDALILPIDSDPSSAEFMARARTQLELKVLISDRISGPGGAAMQLRSHPGIGVIVLDP